MLVLILTHHNCVEIHTHTHTHTGSAAVAENVRQIGRVNAAGQIPTYELGRIVTIPKLQGCRQITVIVRTPVNTYYHPIPTRKDCFGSCPPGQICTAFKTVIRSMKVVCYKRFNCWGKFIWIPIGVRTLCIRDEFNCKCKRRCKPLWCIPPRKFNKRTCDCECPKIRCRPPFTLDPSSCQCRCRKNIVCPHPKVLNFKTCKCVCPNKCKPPFIQDSKCRCICRKRCPRHSYLDQSKCQCVGDCKRFRRASDCNKIDSCSDNRARKCR